MAIKALISLSLGVVAILGIIEKTLGAFASRLSHAASNTANQRSGNGLQNIASRHSSFSLRQFFTCCQ
ncbi:MAG: hypothetical protein M2R45_01021 [Verrucomicrobia subdivision 3 bacterium]|nr:hypothetical protein [Limisphaerales bacterium]MCS1414133.1 hypothetical protein [Limisphaerales bacterium]